MMRPIILKINLNLYNNKQSVDKSLKQKYDYNLYPTNYSTK